MYHSRDTVFFPVSSQVELRLMFISCRVAKQIAPNDAFPRDIDLNLNLYVLWGVRMMPGAQGVIQAHSINISDIPDISPTPVNPVTGDVVTVPVCLAVIN